MIVNRLGVIAGPRFAILQSARSRMFLRVISNAISLRVGDRAGGRPEGVVGTTKGSWLAAIMRSSVFRCRSASPYRYVSSPSHSPPIFLCPPRRPRSHTSAAPAAHLAPLRRSNGFTDSRYPQYSIFISESNFATAARARVRRIFTALFRSLAPEAERETRNPRSSARRENSERAIRSRYPRRRYEVADYETMVAR